MVFGQVSEKTKSIGSRDEFRYDPQNLSIQELFP
jgi:hypothetical protein